jgi:hypothetical protein
MTTIQAVIFGIMVALAPSVLLIPLLWWDEIQPGEDKRADLPGGGFTDWDSCRKSSGWRKPFAAPRIILTVHGTPPFIRGLAQVFAMLTVLTGIFIVLSIGILVAHALEAFRS